MSSSLCVNIKFMMWRGMRWGSWKSKQLAVVKAPLASCCLLSLFKNA